MADITVTLSAEERAFLAELLDYILKETRVEEHRTRAPSYRETVVHKEDMLVNVLKKLGQPAS